MRNPEESSYGDLLEIVQSTRAALWIEDSGVVNKNKKWTERTAYLIAQKLQEFSLRPDTSNKTHSKRSCQSCESIRILSVNACCDDKCVCTINGNTSDGYVPQDALLLYSDSGDAVRFNVCLHCGRIQGVFPQPEMALEGINETSP